MTWNQKVPDTKRRTCVAKHFPFIIQSIKLLAPELHTSALLFALKRGPINIL